MRDAVFVVRLVLGYGLLLGAVVFAVVLGIVLLPLVLGLLLLLLVVNLCPRWAQCRPPTGGEG